jgi:hypothetical protein
MDNDSPHVAVRPGDVVRLHEQDYEYGVGWLTLRLTSSAPPERRSDGWWIPVAGVAIGSDGRDRGIRQVRVRAAALTAPAGAPRPMRLPPWCGAGRSRRAA